ncbi:hypothetical protein LSTR_LSTR006501 [Laodelphax striatellus]|uniref:Uncharacterized protein n=1 Tax=Laodelphax striatellus TaxID=195883 RepID=A0A482WXR5_LAOST|nr:hypothetical protein LSTR_LSTR006501 [Laodelphax striatellus]
MRSPVKPPYGLIAEYEEEEEGEEERAQEKDNTQPQEKEEDQQAKDQNVQGGPKLQESIVNLNRTMEEIKKPASFAEVIKLPRKIVTSVDKAANVRKIQPKEHVVLLKPTELKGNEKQSSEKIRKTLRDSIPKKENIRVKKTVNVRGGGLLIVVDTLDDKKKILQN